MTTPTLEEDMRALVAELDDPAEAEALARAFDVATAEEWRPQEDAAYTPFVYPH